MRTQARRRFLHALDSSRPINNVLLQTNTGSPSLLTLQTFLNFLW